MQLRHTLLPPSLRFRAEIYITLYHFKEIHNYFSRKIYDRYSMWSTSTCLFSSFARDVHLSPSCSEWKLSVLRSGEDTQEIARIKDDGNNICTIKLLYNYICLSLLTYNTLVSFGTAILRDRRSFVIMFSKISTYKLLCLPSSINRIIHLQAIVAIVPLSFGIKKGTIVQ